MAGDPGVGGITRWAMVGTGFMGDLIVPDFALTENVELVAICSRSLETARKRLDDWQIEARIYDDLGAVCADPEIDVVYVATPQSLHYPQARQALEAGKHVLVEKAFTLDQKEAESLATVARDHGRFLMEAMWTRFNPVIRELKRRVDRGDIGEVKHVGACFAANFPANSDHRLFRPDLGGGTLLDQTVYALTIADLFIGSDPTEIVARGQIGETGVEVDAEVLLRYPGARTAMLSTSLTMSIGMAAVIGGTQARIEVEAPMWSPGKATLIVPDAFPETNREAIEITREGRGYVPMLRAVSEAVQNGLLEHELHPLSNAIRIMGLLDEMRDQIFAHDTRNQAV